MSKTCCMDCPCVWKDEETGIYGCACEGIAPCEVVDKEEEENGEM